MRSISIHGASEHNLRHLSLEIPRDALTVFTGVSGSGKSSLVFDTVYREGQRRFLESLSTFARQLVGGIERPQVDRIEGLSPTLSVDQRTSRGRIRSTVGTITDIQDHLRLLFARLGQAHDPDTGRPLKIQSADQIARELLDRFAGQSGMLVALLEPEPDEDPVDAVRRGIRDGYSRWLVDGEPWRPGSLESDDLPPGVREGTATVELVHDRITVKPEALSRMRESIEKALELSGGVVRFVPREGESSTYQSRELDAAGEPFPALEPGLFSFNSPRGACRFCQGVGEGFRPDRWRLTEGGESPPARVIDRCDSLYARIPPGDSFQDLLEESARIIEWARALLAVDELRGVRVWSDLPESTASLFWEGDPASGLPGLLDPFEEVLARTSIRKCPPAWRASFSEGVCRHCGGARLNPFARAVTVGGLTLPEINEIPITALRSRLEALEFEGSGEAIGRPVVREILSRLGYLEEVGVGYLSLGRGAPTLSGGEAQRVRLAGQVGSTLQGVLFVLDEPSIGLHPRDNRRLIHTLRRLRDRGNTVLVVEHDLETLHAADHLVDLGPGAGEDGGELLAQGSVEDLVREERSLTGAHLGGRLGIEVPARRRPPGDRFLEIRGARHRNLRDVDVRIPLGLLVAVTGVSGSGKSSLVHGILRPGLADRGKAGAHREIRGREHVRRVVEIDQKPIGRSPRSNPATYTKIFEPIRELFAATPLARRRRFGAGRFSFNSSEGRCYKCQGAGVLKIEMEFLPSVQVLCDECEGQRYDRETLSVKYRGATIADVLDLSIHEARSFFADQGEIAPTLQILEDIGLGYLKLGHPASALSGGEAQRIKLGAELRRASGEGDLILLDEPTTGLHVEDIRILLAALQGLVDRGATVLVIEHNLELLKVVDHVIDLGPEGGEAGGRLVATGTPEEVAVCPESFTGQALAEVLAAGGSDSVAEGELAAGRRPREVRSGENPEASSVDASRIRVQGARQHNLAHLDLEIPRGRMTVITGVSGSGKSSLAFDTLFAEGQRRYVESLSTYARRFLGRLRNSEVDRIDGLSPAVAIDQRPLSANPHSTLGTVTEITHHLRLLFARLGVPRCASCDLPLIAEQPGALASELIGEHLEKRAYLLAPLDQRGIRPAGPHDPLEPLADSIEGLVLLACQGKGLEGGADAPVWKELDGLVSEGHSRLLVAGREIRLDEERNEVRNSLRALVDRVQEPDCRAWLVMDRVQLNESARSRIAASLEQAYARGQGRAAVQIVEGPLRQSSIFPGCESCGFSLNVEVSPRLFSFNSREGACPDCEGLGLVPRIREGSVLVDASAPLLGGALATSVTELVFPPPGQHRQALEAWAHRRDVPLDEPVQSWDPALRDELFSGDPGDEEPRWPGLEVAVSTWYEGERRQLKPGVFASIVDRVVCPSCQGSRLRDEARRFHVGGHTIDHLLTLGVEEARECFETIELGEREIEIARLVLDEIRTRLEFLVEMGLGYLTLDRPTSTLSGGEAQRIRLAAQVAHRMSGVLYVFDEPTVGLHPRDTRRLLDTLAELRDRENTLVVVEHDPDTIRAADHVIELGPGAGPAGGRRVAEGTVEDLVANPDSLTGDYLAGRRRVCTRTTRRELLPGLKLEGVHHHNLAGVDVEFPLGGLVAVSGVSGSGKSSLVLDVLAAVVREDLRARNPRGQRAGRGSGQSVIGQRLKKIEGLERIRRLALVDQAPIGRSPRSSPATYTGAWEAIRQFYAQLPRSRLKGFSARRFSTSSREGRCPACRGEGAILVDMHFLSDVWLECETCEGQRFNEETLSVRFHGKHVGDLLATSIREAAELFRDHPAVAAPLEVLVEVGLGYLELGQSAPTLSGGEAQRVKLAAELAGKQVEDTLFIFDEPTTGLHLDDVRQLLDVFDRLIAGGGSVIVIEHNPGVLLASDHVIDLGPEGGEAGGRVLVTGTPDRVAACEESHTGRALREELERFTPGA